MKLISGMAIAALLLPGTSRAQDAAPSLESAVEELTREWFVAETRDLPPDELPGPDEFELDIAEMRDDVIRRVADVLTTSDALADGMPDDAANAAAMAGLVEAYEGLESTTPVFTQLALSKANGPAYQSGWRLCAIRVIAETWLSQAREMRAQRDLAEASSSPDPALPPPCEADLRPAQTELLELNDPPRTEFRPGGSAVMEFTVEATGAVSDLSVVDWSVTPSDDHMRDYVNRFMQALRFPARENSCRRQFKISFEMVE